MFNTSTLISLGLTALLCGIIMFYCKRKFAEYEQKLDVMSDLISNIITQLNQIPPSVYDNSGFVEEYSSATNDDTYNDNTYNENVAMNVYEEDEDKEEDNEEDKEEDKRIIVNLDMNGNNNFDTTTATVTEVEGEGDEADDDSWDSEEEDDENEEENDDESHKITIANANLDYLALAPIEVETLDDGNIDVENEENEENEEKEPTNDTDVQDEENTKVVNTNMNADVDYNKLQVGMLKKMVAERNLAQGVSKMKKQELIDVLMKQ